MIIGNEGMGDLLDTKQCPACAAEGADRSCNNLGVYADGVHCHKCGYKSRQAKEAVVQKEKTKEPMVEYKITGVPARGISKRICEAYNYGMGYYNGYIKGKGEVREEIVHVENYTVLNKVVGQKIRTRDKIFKNLGEMKGINLLGKDKFNPNPKLGITITEGALDMLSIAEIQGGKWPVVSIAHGGGSAKRALAAEIEYLSGFKHIVLCFDNDDIGQKALEQCIKILPIGKVKVATLPMKDANEMLMAGRGKELNDCLRDAVLHKPTGIVRWEDIDPETLFKEAEKGYSTPYPVLDEITRGMLRDRIYMFAAGTGEGKSTICKEIAVHLRMKHNLKIGLIFLEEPQKTTVESFIALENSVALWRLKEEPTLVSKQKYDQSYGRILTEGFRSYDHFGSLESQELLYKINCLAVGEKCDFIVLDHISIAISGIESSAEGERRDIDKLMTNLRSVCAATGVGMLIVSHVKRKDGGRLKKSDLRGSGSLEQLSDLVIMLEKDEYGGAELNVVKNRVTGKEGFAGKLEYGFKTGRLLPKKEEFNV